MLTDGWLMRSSAAAREKLPSRATVWKIFSWCRLIAMGPLGLL